MEYIFDVNPDGETVLIKKGEYLKVEGTASTTADKITITNVKVANDSTMSKEMIAQMIQEPLNDMEIEYRYLTELSVEIKNVYCDDDGKEIEEWITLKKVTGTNNNGNSDNKNDNTEYSIIGSWENTQTIDADGNSAEMKITYVISADKFTTIAEYNFMGTQITDTIDGTITKITDGTIYYTFVSPEDGITEAESVAIYKDLTADSVKFKGIDAYGNEVWLTFTKKTNTNNNDNKNDNTEYSIIGSWENTQTIDADGNSAEMKITYVISADKFTTIAEYNFMGTQITDTIDGTITKITDGTIYYTFVSPEDGITEAESVAIYKDLTADSVKFKGIDAYGNEVWLTFTKKTNTNNNDNKNDNTEYSIIGSWGFTQTIENTDGTSMEMKVTYVITADKFTATAEYNIMDTQVKDTIEGTITKIENEMVYYTFLSPEDNTTEVESVVIYKDLTADSVKFKNIDAYGNDVWLTFTKVKM